MRTHPTDLINLSAFKFHPFALSVLKKIISKVRISPALSTFNHCTLKNKKVRPSISNGTFVLLGCFEWPRYTLKHRAQSVHPQSAPLSSHNKLEGRIPLTLTFHPHNISVKNIILKNFKLLQHDPTTAEIFAQPLLISYKRDKNLSNFLVKSTLKSDHQPGTFKCARVRCRTCPFISNANKISGPKRTVAITDHFSCISTNLIYCITCTLCKKVYIGETGRRLGDRFREHLRDVEINDKDASKPVARHFNLPNHSQKHMAVCGLSLHLGNTESRKNIEQKFIFQIGTLSPCGINERFSFL